MATIKIKTKDLLKEYEDFQIRYARYIMDKHDEFMAYGDHKETCYRIPLVNLFPYKRPRLSTQEKQEQWGYGRRYYNVSTPDMSYQYETKWHKHSRDYLKVKEIMDPICLIARLRADKIKETSINTKIYALILEGYKTK